MCVCVRILSLSILSYFIFLPITNNNIIALTHNTNIYFFAGLEWKLKTHSHTRLDEVIILMKLRFLYGDFARLEVIVKLTNVPART